MTAKTKQNVQEKESIFGFMLGRILLTLGYYLVVTPLGWLAKVFGKSWMPLKTDSAQASYWNQRSRQPTSAARFEKQS